MGDEEEEEEEGFLCSEGGRKGEKRTCTCLSLLCPTGIFSPRTNATFSFLPLLYTTFLITDGQLCNLRYQSSKHFPTKCYKTKRKIRTSGRKCKVVQSNILRLTFLSSKAPFSSHGVCDCLSCFSSSTVDFRSQLLLPFFCVGDNLLCLLLLLLFLRSPPPLKVGNTRPKVVS